MTLASNHGRLSSRLRPHRSGPDLDLWPEATVMTGDDIIVAGLSLNQLVDVCGCPTVHSASAVLPSSGHAPDSSRRSAVLAVRVLAVAPHSSGLTVAQVDCRLDDLRLVWSETRMFGRTSMARHRNTLIVRGPSTADLADATDVICASLPRDLRVGDMLAIPSRSIRSDSPQQLHPLTGRRDWRPLAVLEGADDAWWEKID